jgi:hypothetical protein
MSGVTRRWTVAEHDELPDDGKRYRLPGSIYDAFSPRGQRALASLRAEFRAAGFYAEKERRTERTLRVYPERRWRYPLLNPGFVATRRGSPKRIRVGAPSVLCPIYSDGDALIARLLETLPVIDGCTYVAARPKWIGRYFLHGTLVLPLAFDGAFRAQAITFAPMRATLAALQLELSRAAL